MSELFERFLGGANKRVNKHESEYSPMPKEVEMPQGSVKLDQHGNPHPAMPKVQKPKSTIMDVHDKAKSLVASMRAKKTYWEAEIANATEELRQAEVALAGGLLLLDTVAKGITKDNVAQEQATTDNDTKRVLDAVFTNNPA